MSGRKKTIVGSGRYERCSWRGPKGRGAECYRERDVHCAAGEACDDEGCVKLHFHEFSALALAERKKGKK